MLPEGWKLASLGFLARVERGKFSARPRNDPRYFGDGTPFVQTGDVANAGMYLRTYSQSLNEEGLAVSKVFPERTILLTIAANIGATAITTFPVACPDSVVAIQPRIDRADILWLKYALAERRSTLDAYAGQNAQKNINLQVLDPLELQTPPLLEQRVIGKLLATWDSAITTTERLLANSRTQKDALASLVLFGKARLAPYKDTAPLRATPCGRIPTRWQYPKIEDVANEISRRQTDGATFPVLSCTKHVGLVDSLKYFKKQVFSKDLSTYRVVPRGAFAYATNHIEEGAIGYQSLYEFALVSPIYTVFGTTDRVHDGYLYRVLKTERFRQVFEAATNSSVDRRGSLRWNDFKKIHVPLPALEEQVAIAALLEKADSEIEQLEKQVLALRTEKSALMQQLLTGKRRVRLPAPAEAASA